MTIDVKAMLFEDADEGGNLNTSKVTSPISKVTSEDMAAKLDKNTKPIQASVEEDLPLVSNLKDAYRIDNSEIPGKDYVRIELPSHHVAYPFKDVFIRKLKVSDLSKIYRAMVEENFTWLLDAIGGTINRDVRSLTKPDFDFILYWQRINSYPKKPFIINWQSMYGNKNSFKIDNTNLEVNEIKITKQEYQEWYDKGFTIPTMRDIEMLKLQKLTPDQEYIFSNAQYMVGSTIEEKIKRLENCEDLSVIDDISSFKNLVEHSVVESTKVRDTKFEPQSALKHLRLQIDRLDMLIETNAINDISTALDHKMKLEKEIATIEIYVNAKKTYIPKEEELTFSINALKFFPSNN